MGRMSDYDGRGYDPPYEQAPDLSKELAHAEAERDAYREAGARLLQAFQGRFCMAADDMEDCLKTVDMEAEIILKGGE